MLVDVGCDPEEAWEDMEEHIESALFEEGVYAHVTITPFTDEEIAEAKAGECWSAQQYPSCPTPWLAKHRTT